MRALIALIGALAAAGAMAQTAPRSAQPESRFAPLPAPQPKAAPRLDRPAPARPAPPQADVELELTLAEVLLTPEGGALAALPALADVIAPAIGRPTTLEGLEALRRALTEALVAEGYVSSGLRLVEIDLARGAAIYEIVEGRLTDIRVTGAPEAPGSGDLSAAWVRARLAAPEGPFDLDVAEERLRVLLRDRAVARVDAAVRPGLSPGDTILDLEVTPNRPYDLRLTLANDTPDGIGEETARLTGAFRNALIPGDEIRAEGELSEGRRRVVVEGDAPIRPGGPAPFFAFEYAQNAFVSAPLSDLDVETSFIRLGGGLRLPLIESSRTTLTAIAGFDWKRARSELLGQPFSFSEGVRNGVSRTSVASASLEYVDLGDERTLALRASINAGLDILGATTNADAPDGRFVAFLGQAQVAQRVSDRLTIIARAQGQVATDPLLPLEQVAIGGRETVRGFGEALVTGDDAALASLEGRFALADLALPEVTPPGAAAPLVLAPFIDAGQVWRKGGGSDRLIGAGAGLLWAPAPHVDVALYVGGRLKGPSGGGGLQGEGVHLAVSIALP